MRESVTDVPVIDRKVCSCFSVGRAAIEKTIVANRLKSCAQVGEALRAGTNCGSCIPEIEEILLAMSMPMLSESANRARPLCVGGTVNLLK